MKWEEDDEVAADLMIMMIKQSGDVADKMMMKWSGDDDNNISMIMMKK